MIRLRTLLYTSLLALSAGCGTPASTISYSLAPGVSLSPVR